MTGCTIILCRTIHPRARTSIPLMDLVCIGSNDESDALAVREYPGSNLSLPTRDGYALIPTHLRR